ncbi:alpha/beta fold hydrolase [Glycocaulis profundi]|nr:alpha/beta fold hydrolase [Glycocaulis profundi]
MTRLLAALALAVLLSACGGERGVSRFVSFDGTEIVYRDAGGADAPAVVLIHGLLASGETDFTDTGLAGELRRQGFRVIIPDLRGHGLSGRPGADEAWARDAMVRDQFALLDHLDLLDYDLVGRGMGGQIALKMMAAGAEPRRAVVIGMGEAGALDPQSRRAAYADALLNIDTPEAAEDPEQVREFARRLRRSGGDAAGGLAALSTITGVRPEALGRVSVPVLLIDGPAPAAGDVAALAERLPEARVGEADTDRALRGLVTGFLGEG